MTSLATDMQAASTITAGVGHILSYDNIAIDVLAMCLIGAIFLIIWLLRFIFKLLPMLSSLQMTMGALLERLNHHD